MSRPRDRPGRTVGILAYGSLISTPGVEIEGGTTETKEQIHTPFNVEFARSSRKRGGAPTLVPVETGGVRVGGQIFVLDVEEQEAGHRLWRREIDAVGSGRLYKAPDVIGPNTVVVRRIEDLEGVDIVLYTDIAANIDPLTAGSLAQLAIDSVHKADRDRDGISYLIAAKRNGIRTALSDRYEEEILQRLAVSSLEEALASLRL